MNKLHRKIHLYEEKFGISKLNTYFCENFNEYNMRKEFTTKNGFKTYIDRYDVVINGLMYKRVWGKTKARQYARNYTSNLFSQQTNRVEIVNCYTGEVTKIS